MSEHHKRPNGSAKSENASEDEGQQEEEGPLSLIPKEVLESLPEEQRGHLSRVFSMFTQFAGPAIHPILQKVTTEHVSVILANLEKREVREHQSEGSWRRYQLLYFALSVSVVTGLIIYFTASGNTSLVAAILSGIAGLVGGYGVGRANRN